MSTFQKRLHEISEEVKRLGTWGKVLRRGLEFLFVWLGGKVIDVWTDGWISRQLDRLSHHIAALGKEPIGVVSLVLAVLFTAVMIVSLSFVLVSAWWETRLRKERKPPPLTWDEQQVVQPLRALWQVGIPAVGWLNRLWEFSKGQWRCRGDYSLLLAPIGEALDKAAREMDSAALDDTLRAEQVHKRFHALYDAYYKACFWIARIAVDQDLNDRSEEYTKLRDQWAEAHKSFYAELERVNQYTEHRGKLGFSLTIFDDSLSRFLRSAGVKL